MRFEVTKDYVLKIINLLKKNGVSDSRRYNGESFWRALVKPSLSNHEKLARNAILIDAGLLNYSVEFRLQTVTSTISKLTKYMDSIVKPVVVDVPDPPKPKDDEIDIREDDDVPAEEPEDVPDELAPVREFDRAIKKASRLF
jgi:hypothetical protein